MKIRKTISLLMACVFSCGGLTALAACSGGDKDTGAVSSDSSANWESLFSSYLENNWNNSSQNNWNSNYQSNWNSSSENNWNSSSQNSWGGSESSSESSWTSGWSSGWGSSSQNSWGGGSESSSESSSQSNGGNDSESSEGAGEGFDYSKTLVRVYHFNAGYGNKWVYELKQNFEELMKDVQFEENKKGVQVLITGDMKARISADAWREEPFDVLFLEGPEYFYEMMQDDVVAPLDDIMKVANPDDDNQKIEDKMTQQQRDAYTYNGKYYGIPHYAGHYGFIYNKDMFDKYNFYFAAEPDAAGNVFITDTNTEKSLGPDGKMGIIDGIDYSADDGLPTTFEEFFTLCDEINANFIDPICWPGKYSHQHVTHFMDNLVANIEGAEQMNLNYTFNGKATDLIVLDESDLESGEFVTEELDITFDNGDELSRQAGKYYAMDFVSKILTNVDYYNEQDGLDETLLHSTMQKKFLENGAINSDRPNAMLMDGVWWQMEADSVFERMARQDAKWSKENRNFGWMPLPQPTQEEADKIASGEKKSVYMDYLNAVACIKSNTPSEGVKNAALEFLKYAYTDKALCDFTYTTGTTIGVDYLDKIDYAQLTPYSKSLIDYINKSDLVYQVSGNVQYAMNIRAFRPTNLYGSGTITGIVIGFTDKKYSKDMTAADYFTGYQTWYKGLAW